MYGWKHKNVFVFGEIRKYVDSVNSVSLKDVNFFFVQMKRDDEQYKIYSYIQTSLHKMRSN